MNQQRKIDKLLSILRRAFNESFAKDTCYPPTQSDWKPENPAFGHCAVATLIAQNIFGGEIVGCSHYHHYWLRWNGIHIDFTQSQFPADTRFCIDSTPSREELLDSPRAKEAKTRERYELMKERFWTNMLTQTKKNKE